MFKHLKTYSICTENKNCPQFWITQFQSTKEHPNGQCLLNWRNHLGKQFLGEIQTTQRQIFGIQLVGIQDFQKNPEFIHQEQVVNGNSQIKLSHLPSKQTIVLTSNKSRSATDLQRQLYASIEQNAQVRNELMVEKDKVEDLSQKIRTIQSVIFESLRQDIEKLQHFNNQYNLRFTQMDHEAACQEEELNQLRKQLREDNFQIADRLEELEQFKTCSTVSFKSLHDQISMLENQRNEQMKRADFYYKQFNGLKDKLNAENKLNKVYEKGILLYQSTLDKVQISYQQNLSMIQKDKIGYKELISQLMIKIQKLIKDQQSKFEPKLLRCNTVSKKQNESQLHEEQLIKINAE